MIYNYVIEFQKLSQGVANYSITQYIQMFYYRQAEVARLREELATLKVQQVHDVNGDPQAADDSKSLDNIRRPSKVDTLSSLQSGSSNTASALPTPKVLYFIINTILQLYCRQIMGLQQKIMWPAAPILY